MFSVDIGAVIISFFRPNHARTAGDTSFILECSATVTPNPLPSNVSPPKFEWFFGPTNTSISSASDVTVSGNTYTSTLRFSPLHESHAGKYTCRLGGNSRLAANIMITVLVNGKTNQSAYIHTMAYCVTIVSCCTAVAVPISNVNIISHPVSPIVEGTCVTLTCTVELGPSVVESDLSVLMVDAQLSRDGTPLNLTGPTVAGTTFTYTIQLNSFGRNDSGNYTCTATARSQSPLPYISSSGTTSSSSMVRVITGKTKLSSELTMVIMD